MLFLSSRGYRAIALDMNSYNDTDALPSAASYTAFDIVGDIVGLLDALGLDRVFLITESTDVNELVEKEPWLSSEKLVVKPDMLFGKSGLVALNLDLAENDFGVALALSECGGIEIEENWDKVGDFGFASELGSYAEYSRAPNEEEVLHAVYGPEATMTGICKQAIECITAAA
ncbi:hypothetical protein RHGRI_033403 [Rhododendron griersonianum]|uniref:Uncharacterized protein n=1 Tax=Rhododendron griersonianum TaxID=479676 RepID=A0AAV6HZR2_9ERIC|nr:hypothetical protein RHGRI_033403 [Rhododendron griersonianum]